MSGCKFLNFSSSYYVQRGMILVMLLGLVLSLCGCQDANKYNIEYKYPIDKDERRNERAGKIFKKDLILYSSTEGKGLVTIGQAQDGSEKLGASNKTQRVHGYIDPKQKENCIWKIAMAKFSSMPIKIADRDSGVILTDWYQLESNSVSRYKFNFILHNDRLTNDSIAVEVFKEKKDLSSDIWYAVKVSKSMSTDIKAEILNKAHKICG